MRSFLTAVKTFIIIRCMPEMVGNLPPFSPLSLPPSWLPLCVITGDAISGMEMQACFMDKSPAKARDERVDQDHDNITNKVNNTHPMRERIRLNINKNMANYCRPTMGNLKLKVLEYYLHEHEWEFSKFNWFPCKSHTIQHWYINCCSSSEWTDIYV